METYLEKVRTIVRETIIITRLTDDIAETHYYDAKKILADVAILLINLQLAKPNEILVNGILGFLEYCKKNEFACWKKLSIIMHDLDDFKHGKLRNFKTSEYLMYYR